MAEKPMVDPVNAEDASDPVPSPRAAEPEPAGGSPPKSATPAKATKRAKATKAAATPAKASKAAKAAKAAKVAKAAKSAEASKSTKAVKKAGAVPKKATTQATEAEEPIAEPPAEPPATPSVPPAEPAAAPVVPPSLVPTQPGAWVAAVREMVTRPDQPPQRLAELIVAELGPRAAAWVGWLRETYPDPPAHGIARLAAHEAGRLSRAMILAEATGHTTALSFAAMLWVRATVVLRIAAAYGHDPADPRRAADLIELLRLHDDRELPWMRRLRLVGYAIPPIASRRTPVRAGFRALLVSSMRDDWIERLAHRAAGFYRTGGQRQGSQDSTSASSASISSPHNP